MRVLVVEVPSTCGAGMSGCALGPQKLVSVDLLGSLRSAGADAVHAGVVACSEPSPIEHPNNVIKRLGDVAAWTAAIADTAYRLSTQGTAVFLGGDHSISAGTIAGVSRAAFERGRPLFVLWIDAHPDFHTLETTYTGNLHGVPLAYACGLQGFEGYFPSNTFPVNPRHVAMIGIREPDDAELDHLQRHSVQQLTFRISEIQSFLARVAEASGELHVSFDIDAIDPSYAPGTSTPAPNGLCQEEALTLMEILGTSGLVKSLDLVELNPTFDTADSKTAHLMVRLATSLFGAMSHTTERLSN